jgi:hypothetical protein
MLQPNATCPPNIVEDPVPDPEPSAPSLPEPDTGVFHHEPVPEPNVPSPS